MMSLPDPKPDTKPVASEPRRQAIISAPSQVAELLRSACTDQTDALFCGASFAVAHGVVLVRAEESSIWLRTAQSADSRITAGSTCTLTFSHRGDQVVCTSLVVRLVEDKEAQMAMIEIETPKFLAIRESRKHSRKDVREELQLETMLVGFGKTTHVKTIDLSIDGARIALSPVQASILKVGDAVELVFGFHENRISCRSRIRWIRNENCGIAFECLDWRQRAMIVRILESCGVTGASCSDGAESA